MSATATSPAVIEFPVTDERVIGFDQAPGLPPDGTVSDPVVTLRATTGTGDEVALPTPTVEGTVISVMLTGSDLVVGGSYLLTITFDGGASAPQLTSTTTVVCVQR